MFVDNVKYNVLFMRDDSRVRSFRISNRWLSLIVYGSVVLMILAIAGAAMTFKYWRLAHTLDDSVNEMRLAVDRKDVELERLLNLNKIMQAEMTALISTHKRISPVTVPAVSQAAIPEPVGSETPKVEVSQPGKVQIEGFRLAHSGNHLNLTYTIKNLSKDKIAGRINFYVAGSDGKFAKVDVNGDKSYNIKFSKQARTDIATSGKDGVRQIRIEVVDDHNRVLLSQNYGLDAAS